MATGFAFASSACALDPTAPEAAEVQAPIVGGVLDTGDPAVIEFANGCSAEVISPHVLLTAGHCVSPAPAKKDMVAFTGPDDSDSSGGMVIKVKEVHAHPQYDANADASAHDVGIVILQTPVEIKPLPINRTPLTNAQKGQPVRIIGYGTTAANGNDVGFGQRRQATSPLIGFDDDWVNVGTSTANQCFGDSGGPALMMIGGQEVIVGVDSFGTDSGSTCHEYNSDTRIDQQLDFIDPFVQANDPGSVAGAGGAGGAASAGAGGAGGGAGGGGANAGAGGGVTTAGGNGTGGAGNVAGGAGNSGAANSGTAGSLSGTAGAINNVGGGAGTSGAASGVAGAPSNSASGAPNAAGSVGTLHANDNASSGCSCSVAGDAAPMRQGFALALAFGSLCAFRRKRRAPTARLATQCP